jgi:hypothetical protein
VPTGTIIIGTIGTQTAGVPFTVAGTYALSGGSFVEQLVYRDNAGANVPINSPVVNLHTATWTLNHPGLTTPGAHTVSIRDKLTGATVVSNSFTVLPAPVLSISPISSKTPGATFTLSGSYSNFPAVPALIYTIDGGASQPVTTVSGGTFSTTATAPTALGQHHAVVSASGTASPVALFTVAPAARSISFSIPANLAPGQAFTFTGALSGYSTIPGLTYSIDGLVPVGVTGVTLTGWSMQITAPSAAGSHTITVTDGSISTPVSFTVVATPRTVAPAQPSGVLTATAFTFTGTLAGYTTAPALSYSLDGGAPVTMSGVSVASWATSVTISTVGQHTLVVSDTFGTAPGSTTFTVAAATPAAVTWNPADKASIITLSNANKTATATGSATPFAQPQAVRATVPINITNQPVVWEVTLVTLTQNLAVGMADSTYNLLSAGGLGSDIVSVGAFPSTGSGSQPAQSVFYNKNQLTAGNGVSSANGDIVSIAANGKSFYFSTPTMRATAGVSWNNSTTADPVTNVGGLAFAGAPNFPYYPAFSEQESPGAVTLNDGTTAFSTFLAGYQSAHPGATLSLLAQASLPPTKTISPNQP